MAKKKNDPYMLYSGSTPEQYENYERQRQLLAEEEKKQASLLSDTKTFSSFQDKNMSLIDNPDSALMTPKFQLPGSSDAKKRNKIVAGMMEMFNARKNQILERKAQPGISQTRLDYQ